MTLLEGNEYKRLDTDRLRLFMQVALHSIPKWPVNYDPQHPAEVELLIAAEELRITHPYGELSRQLKPGEDIRLRNPSAKDR